MQPPQSGSQESDKKFSPLFMDRKNDFTASLYQLSKVLEKDPQTYSKLYKTKEVQQKKVQKTTVTTSRPTDKANDKLSIYQYVQSKTKKPEDQKSALNLSNQASSRASSRMIAREEHNDSLINKAADTNAAPSKRVGSGVNDSAKLKVTPGHQKNLSTTFIKGSQKASPTNPTKQINIFQGSAGNLSFNEVAQDYSKTPDSKRFEAEQVANNFNETLANKLKMALQGLQGDLQNARHRRGLSSGQTPIFIDQQMLQEKIKPIELVQNDPQQEQDEFFEKFFHSDKMTFEFEKHIISQRNNKSQNMQSTMSTGPTNHKPATAHTRTRSIEDPSSLLPTKASSRWNTKRSSVGEEHISGKEQFNLIEQLSDLDKTDADKEDRRKYLRG